MTVAITEKAFEDTHKPKNQMEAEDALETDLASEIVINQQKYHVVRRFYLRMVKCS